jgi:hypothetical protein
VVVVEPGLPPQQEQVRVPLQAPERVRELRLGQACSQQGQELASTTVRQQAGPAAELA